MALDLCSLESDYPLHHMHEAQVGFSWIDPPGMLETLYRGQRMQVEVQWDFPDTHDGDNWLVGQQIEICLSFVGAGEPQTIWRIGRWPTSSRIGTESIWVQIPEDLPLGIHTLRISAYAAHIYYGDYYGFQVRHIEYPGVQIIEGAPVCQFSVDPWTGTAPLTVTFTDESTVPPDAPKTAILWDFGDGEYGHDPVMQHTYHSAGIYTVTLSVTNRLGSCMKSYELTVAEGEPHPVFKRVFFPDHVDVNETFTPQIVIENQGGAGLIWIQYDFEGVRYDLVASQHIGGYGTEWTVPVGTHAISWWTKRAITETQYCNFIFYTGIVGETHYTHQQFVQILVYVPDGNGPSPECYIDADCPVGFVCENGVCVSAGDGPDWAEWLRQYGPYVAIGGGVGLLGYVLLRGLK